MKKPTLTLLALLVLTLTGCGERDQRGKVSLEQQPKTEKDYEVTFLFEVDGVKVYKFYDDKWVYFTNANGKTEYSYTTTRRTGKHTVHRTTHEAQSINNKEE